ncbi:hypothetical protein ACH3VR_20735 [Microbacterium sp. B2969]|uniref:Alpha/beta hydrolase n=1 Tax=Microbacterium alkaliflavum TaxID=3248839 RepID=A0ABW7QD34_9MICO
MGDLDIRSGGIVSVDTESLYAAADRLDALGRELDDLTGLFRRAAGQVELVPRIAHTGAVGRAYGLVTRTDSLAGRPDALASRLRDTAALYETVELRARRAAAEAAGDAEAIARIDARLEAIEAEHPAAGMRAWWAELWRDASWAQEFTGPAPSFGAALAPGAALFTGAAAWSLGAAVRGSGVGVVGPDERLAGAAPPVRLVPLTPSIAATAGAPTSLAAAAARIPSDDAGRVRVERYTMPDGSRQFAVYVRGTTGQRADEAWGWDANVDLARGRPSASYEATLEALRAAGAEPGDVVHAFGHSQGGTIAARLAVEGGFDTQTLVTLGSPVDAGVGADTLSVAIRHGDDPVGALAGGGDDIGFGAPGSFIAERSIDAGPFAEPFAPHHIGAYEETAAMLDDSTDPRMGAVRERLGELQEATSVEVLEFGAAKAGACPVDLVPDAAPGVSPCVADEGRSLRSS